MSTVIPNNVLSVIESFSPVLKSLDIRTVAIKLTPSQKTWVNLITSFVVSNRSVDEVKVEHNKLPKIENDQFAIFLKASVDGRILDGLSEGYITFPADVPVTVLTRKMELYTLKVYSRQ